MVISRSPWWVAIASIDASALAATFANHSMLIFASVGSPTESGFGSPVFSSTAKNPHGRCSNLPPDCHGCHPVAARKSIRRDPSY